MAGVTEAFTAEQAKVVFDTNVIGLLRVTRAVLPSMRQKRDGLIINIGSILGRVTFPFIGIYGASKFAVEALTDSLRYEVSQLGVEVVEVQPSAYPTNFLTGIQTPAGTEVTKSYGEVGQIPDAMLKAFMSRFEGTLLGVDPDAFNHDTEEFSAIAATLIRHNAISNTLSTKPESFEPLFLRRPDGEVDARPWCMGFYAVMKLRLLAWSRVLNPTPSNTDCCCRSCSTASTPPVAPLSTCEMALSKHAVLRPRRVARHPDRR